jgi:hypothetical protein
MLRRDIQDMNVRPTLKVRHSKFGLSHSFWKRLTEEWSKVYLAISSCGVVVRGSRMGI